MNQYSLPCELLAQPILSWFDHPNNIWRRVHIMKLVTLQPPVSGVHIFSWALCPPTPSVYFGFEILTAVLMKSSISWYIMCSPVKVNRRFGGTYRLHLQGRTVIQARNKLQAGGSACCLLLASFLLGSHFNPEDGDTVPPKHKWILPTYTTL
jgi:hypothetical protein